MSWRSRRITASRSSGESFCSAECTISRASRLCAEASGDGPLFHHVGIYAYRRAALSRFVALPPSPLEKREKLEQLRALEAGMSIAVARVDSVPLSVDTPADLAKANQFFARKSAS